MNFRKTYLFFIVAALLVVLTACGNDKNDNNENENDVTKIQFPEIDRTNLTDEIVAKFEGGEITGEEFASFLSVQAFLNPELPVNDVDFREGIINELVMEKIIGGQVETEDWVKERIDLLWEQVEIIYTDEELKDAYETLDLSEEKIRELLTRLYKVESYFRDQVTEDEINELYEEAKIQFTNATFTHILIGLEEMNDDGEMVEIRTEEEALEKANDLYEQLKAGADMNELATEHTDDPGSVESGGTYEDSPIIRLVPEFRDAILAQEIDEIGEPVKTDYGYHIIRVEELQVTPLENLREPIISQLVYEKYVDYLTTKLPEIELNLE